MVHYSFVYIIHMKTIKLSFFVSPKEKSIGMCSYVTYVAGDKSLLYVDGLSAA